MVSPCLEWMPLAEATLAGPKQSSTLSSARDALNPQELNIIITHLVEEQLCASGISGLSPNSVLLGVNA